MPNCSQRVRFIQQFVGIRCKVFEILLTWVLKMSELARCKERQPRGQVFVNQLAETLNGAAAEDLGENVDHGTGQNS